MVTLHPSDEYRKNIQDFQKNHPEVGDLQRGGFSHLQQRKKIPLSKNKDLFFFCLQFFFKLNMFLLLSFCFLPPFFFDLYFSLHDFCLQKNKKNEVFFFFFFFSFTLVNNSLEGLYTPLGIPQNRRHAPLSRSGDHD